jgi:Ca2+/Na+ antiporter
MNLTFREKELGSFLLIWGFVGFPITLLAYFDTEWSRYFWIGVVVLYTFTLTYAYLFRKTDGDKIVDTTSQNSEHYDNMTINGNWKNQSHLSKKSQACFLGGSLSGLLSAVILMTSLGYILENEITVANPLFLILLILIPAVISIGLIYWSTRV